MTPIKPELRIEIPYTLVFKEIQSKFRFPGVGSDINNNSFYFDYPGTEYYKILPSLVGNHIKIFFCLKGRHYLIPVFTGQLSKKCANPKKFNSLLRKREYSMSDLDTEGEYNNRIVRINRIDICQGSYKAVVYSALLVDNLNPISFTVRKDNYLMVNFLESIQIVPFYRGGDRGDWASWVREFIEYILEFTYRHLSGSERPFIVPGEDINNHFYLYYVYGNPKSSSGVANTGRLLLCPYTEKELCEKQSDIPKLHLLTTMAPQLHMHTYGEVSRKIDKKEWSNGIYEYLREFEHDKF